MTKCAVIQLIFDYKAKEAIGCIKETMCYEWYKSYLKQFNYGGNRLVPITRKLYNTLTEIHREQTIQQPTTQV